MKSAFDKLIPVFALLGGVVTTFGIASVVARPTTEEIQAREQFAQFDAREQDKIRHHARRLQSSTDELKRLREVHEAVTAEPELKSKLESLRQWLSNVDNATQNELAPSGEFANEWKTLVEQKFAARQTQIPDIDIPLESREGVAKFTVAENQFNDFVDRIVSEYATWEEQADLNSYERGSAATLAKCVWICEGVIAGDRQDYGKWIRAVNSCYEEIMGGLAEEDDRFIIRKWEQSVGRNARFALAIRVIFWGMTHCARQLRKEYPAPSDTELVDSFDGLTRDEQLQMIANPSVAKQDLDLVAIREFGDESIKLLLQDYETLSAKLKELSRQKDGLGGRQGRGPGGREGFGGRPGPRQ